MKARELRNELRAAGAAFVRCQGSHQLWKLKDGTIVSFSVKGSHSDIAKEDVARVRRAIKGKDARQQRKA